MNRPPASPVAPLLPPPLGEGRGGGAREAVSPARTPSPLAALNAHITQASQAASGAPRQNPGPWPELRSAQRFRETWERLGAEATVVQASHRAPENAGPLNSHMLVLRTLGLMSDLSPHYLRRFLAHAQGLLWLEQAQGLLRAPVVGKGGAAKAVKPAKAIRPAK